MDPSSGIRITLGAEPDILSFASAPEATNLLLGGALSTKKCALPIRGIWVVLGSQMSSIHSAEPAGAKFEARTLTGQ